MKREIPEGFTRTDVEKIIEDWNNLFEEVMNGYHHETEEEECDCDEFYLADGFIDRWFEFDNYSFCVTTDMNVGIHSTRLSEDIELRVGEFGDDRMFNIHELKSLIRENQLV